MSQSILEQLNVDRREFADAGNALTKFVFLKYQLKCGRYDSSATSVDLREGFPFQSVTVLSNEGSVHLILFDIKERGLNWFIQTSFDEERGMNCFVQTSFAVSRLACEPKGSMCKDDGQ
ncbi:hypothetical protein Tco_1147420, partial [Tanacetum coccineum]